MPSIYLEGVHSMPHSISEVAFTVSILSLDVLVFGTAILLSALGTSGFMFAVSVLSLLMVGFGVVVLLLALGYREKEDIAKKRLLTKAGLVLCGLMITVTPLSLNMYWAFSWRSPLDWDFWSLAAMMSWYHLLVLALFASIGGLIIERASSSVYSEGDHSMPQSTSEVMLTVCLSSLLVLGFGTAILLSALGTSEFMFAVSVLSLLMVGFGVAILLLALGHRERVDVAKTRLLTKVGLVVCGLMIIISSAFVVCLLGIPVSPSSSMGLVVTRGCDDVV